MKHKIATLFLVILNVCSVASIDAANRKTTTDAPSATGKSPEKKDDASKSKKDKEDPKAEAKAAPAESAEALAAKVMDPSRFFGQAMIGYAAAKASPVIMSKLFCYCGCDITDKHNNLLDCFTSVHGVDCHICQEEAVLALKLARDNTPDSEIQKIIDDKYSENYPFEEESPTYKNYKAHRLYGGGGGAAKTPDSGAAASKSSTAKFGEGAAGPEPPGDDKKWVPKLKPGKKPAACCSGDHKNEQGDSKGAGDQKGGASNQKGKGK